MMIKRMGMSSLAKEAGFGTRIWSEPGYWGGRFYHLIVAAGTTTILLTSLYPYVSLWFLAGILIAYAAYFIIRFYFISGREAAYYRPWLQFFRAQFFIVMLTLLIGWLGKPGISRNLWLLYTLQLMIIGRHLSTSLLLAGILQVWLLLAAVRFWISPAPSVSQFIVANPDLIGQCAWVVLIGFVTHYLLRNIDARDETIAIISRINALVDKRQKNYDIQSHWEFILRTYLKNVGGKCGSIWLFNQNTGEIRPITNLSHCLGKACPVFNRTGNGGTITINLEHPIAEVVRTGQPIYCKPHSPLVDHLTGARDSIRVCSLPGGVLASILVPISDQNSMESEVLGVLCLDFDQANPLREHLIEHYFEFLGDMAHRVSSGLRFIQQMEEQQTLRDVGVQVSTSLRRNEIISDTLDALTGPLGFELATISLVDEDARIIRCVDGRNVPPEWIAAAIHPLSSSDIQADIVRKAQLEVIKGWDDRFDCRIYNRFHHHQLIRAFVPICRQQSVNGDSSPVQGVVEVGYDLRHRDTITPDQLVMLTTLVGQAAIAIEKATLFEQTLRHHEMLAQLHQASHDIACARRPGDVLEKLGETLQQALKADIVMIYRYDRKTKKIELPHIFGDVWGRRPIRVAPLDRGIVAQIIHTGQPYYAADAVGDPLLSEPDPPLAPTEKKGYRRTFTLRQNIKSFVGVPMLMNGETVGVLCVNYRRRHAFGPHEKSALGIAAQLAAVALRNAEFSAFSAQQAVKDERDRLAGQLHDSVSQFLPAIQLMADTALKHLSTQPDQAMHWLQRIQQITRQTMAEIRLNLFEISMTTTNSRNLRQALLESASLARENFNLEVGIMAENIPGELRIPIETELFLICREAIVNAGRHAQARRMIIQLSQVDNQVRLQIEDDGCGFDPSTLSTQGIHGLKSMRQRVNRMGGVLSIESQLGKGTTIKVVVPT